MDEELKYRKKNLWMYPVGTVGRDGIYQLFTNFIFTFIVFTQKLTAAQLGAITLIMVLARVFDALNDPVMGYIIEQTRTRFGKFKPWLAIGMVTTAIVVITAFNMRLTGWAFVAAFAVVYFLYSITFTMQDISYWGMIPSLSSDPNARNQYTSRATLFAGIGGTLVSMLVPILTTGSHSIRDSAAGSYGLVAIAVCVLGLIFICFTIFGVKEPHPATKDVVRSKTQHTGVKHLLSTIVKNRELMWIIVIFLIQQIGNGIVIGGIGSYYVYFEFGYEGGLYSIFSTVGVAATAILMVTYPMITRKLHRKSLMKIMMIVSTVGYAMMLIPGILLPEGNMIKFWLLTLGYMASNFGQYCFYLVLMISIMNTVEYNEYLCGQRDEAVISSVRPFLTKLASALIVAFNYIVYLVFQVLDTTNGIATIEQEAEQGVYESDEAKVAAVNNLLANVQNGQKVGMLIAMSVVPFVLMLIAHLLYQKKYTLDEDEYNRICAVLKDRNEDAGTVTEAKEN